MGQSRQDKGHNKPRQWSFHKTAPNGGFQG